MNGGAAGAGGSYGQATATVGGVDVDTAAASTDGGAVADAGRAGSGAIRDQARAVAAASAPLGSSPAGAQLVVATMDQHMDAMQRQLDATQAQNRLLALRLRELAAAYRGGAGGGGGSPLSALRGLSMPSLGGGGGLSGLSGLAGLPASFMGNHTGSSSGSNSSSLGGAAAGGAAGVAAGSIPLSDVSFEGKGVWPGGRGAIEHYLAESLDRMGITDPRARANWTAGLLTIAEHESTFRTEAINLGDSNAHGPRQVDGGPLHSTRGPFQVEPATFASHHQPGTSNHVWDPVASGCAIINYTMSRYGVARDGHNLRSLVGQANSGVHHGY